MENDKNDNRAFYVGRCYSKRMVKFHHSLLEEQFLRFYKSRRVGHLKGYCYSKRESKNPTRNLIYKNILWKLYVSAIFRNNIVLWCFKNIKFVHFVKLLALRIQFDLFR